jgi:hypothetical protein
MPPILTLGSSCLLLKLSAAPVLLGCSDAFNAFSLDDPWISRLNVPFAALFLVFWAAGEGDSKAGAQRTEVEEARKKQQ